MEIDNEGFRYPSIDIQHCINCDLCSRVCPVINVAVAPSCQQIAYAAINHNDAVRINSSSGGIFTLIAEHVLTNHGVVFGAAVTEDLTIKHIAIEDSTELGRLRGSKYVQSDPGSTFAQARAYLRSGRQVLYTGTPCQIAGLRSFLGQEYDNLICQDIICHGAPSPAVWQAYLRYQSDRVGSSAKTVCFRSKSAGWTNYRMHISFENGTAYEETFQKDPFMKAFLADLSLRPSCYQCAFKGQQRMADITLADFWGIQKVLPQMYDDRGVSLVFVNTPKGAALFSSLQDHMRVCPTDANEAIAHNKAMLCSAKCPIQRAQFWKDLQQTDFAQAVTKACPSLPLGKRFVKRAKQILKKILKK